VEILHVRAPVLPIPVQIAEVATAVLRSPRRLLRVFWDSRAALTAPRITDL
jgi:hypothetical protein